MNIYLIGYMGSGKSTIGKKFAQLIHYEFIDMDILFEERYKIPVMTFFEKYDEEAFRTIESKLLEETADLENTVISTGGGTPCFHNNMEFIKNNGISIYIRMHPKSLAIRLLASKKKRPLAQISDPIKLEEQITERLKIREPFYLQADIIIKGEDITAEKVRKALIEEGLVK